MKGKKGTGILFIGLASMAIFALILLLIIGYTISKIDSENTMCEDIKPSQSGYNCCEGCHKLDMKYLKYEFHGSLFGANEENCFCAGENNIVSQIW